MSKAPSDQRFEDDVFADLEKLSVGPTPKKKSSKRKLAEAMAVETQDSAPGSIAADDIPDDLDTDGRKQPPPPPALHPEQHAPLDKGKAKVAPVPETPETTSREPQPRFVLNVPRKWAPLTVSLPLITKFDGPIHIYHNDHQAPFRGLVAEGRGRQTEDEISKYFEEDARRKLLVTVSGRDFEEEMRQTMEIAIEAVCGRKPEEIQKVLKSVYMVVRMKKGKDVEKLLGQHAVYDPNKKALTVFRKYETEAKSTRAIEVCDITEKAQFDELRKFMVDEEGIEVVSEEKVQGKTVWKIIVPRADFRITARPPLSSGAVFIKSGPICEICHSDDHRCIVCPWYTTIPGVEFKGFFRRGARSKDERSGTEGE